MAQSNDEFDTVLGADATFKGDLSFESAAKVLGRFEGSIKAKGRVYVADGSTCKATLIAKEIAVEGLVDGNVEAEDRVELKPTGKILGDVVAKRMTMADGATLDGHVRIGFDDEGGKGRAGSTTEMKPEAQAVPARPVAAKK